MGRTFDLLGICCTGVVCVNLLRRCALVEGDETAEKVRAGSVVVVATSVIWEVITEW